MELRGYQKQAVNFILRRLYVDDQPGAGVFADPGLGKTFITLEVIDRLFRANAISRVLIVAPLQTCLNTWPHEIKKFGYPFSFDVVHGPKKLAKLHQEKQIDILNVDGLKWLHSQKMRPWDLIICDESTLFKNWTAKRTKILRNLLTDIPKRIILTGTPTPNTYADLFSQVYILDNGETLGKTIGFFREHYCRKGGFKGYSWEFREDREEAIKEKIKDLAMRIDESDHLDLPARTLNPLYVNLPPTIQAEYERLETSLFMAIQESESETLILASSAGAKYQLCKQVANGGAYQKDDLGGRVSHLVHDAKTTRIVQLHEELNRKPMIVAYQTNHDYDRLVKAFGYPIPVIRGGTKNTQELIRAWNAGELPLLAVQPQAMSHGVNLQFGGHHICWLGLTDNNEVFLQFNKRLHRSGQKHHVFIHTVLAKDTVDEAMFARLASKTARQKSLLDALRDYHHAKSKSSSTELEDIQPRKRNS